MLLGRKNFDHHRAAEFRIDGFIDSALSALTELLEDFVFPASIRSFKPQNYRSYRKYRT